MTRPLHERGAGESRKPPAASRVIWAAVGAVIVALAVGVPVGLLAGRDSAGSTPPPIDPPPVRTMRPPPTPADRESSPSSSRPPTSRTQIILPATTGVSLLAAEPPPGLSAPQLVLWDTMQMAGVDYASCLGYPDGEAIAGVAASLQCRISDPALGEPITYYQFRSAAHLAGYVELRGSEVNRLGECVNGDESTGTWMSDGATVGPMVCLDNVKNNTTFFKIVFGSATGNTAVVIQDETPATVYSWWLSYAAEQFYEL